MAVWLRVLALFGGVFSVVFLRATVTAFRLAAVARRWRVGFRQLDARVAQGFDRLEMECVVHGRPARIVVAREAAKQRQRWVTRVAVCTRHPDDVAAGRPPPPLRVDDWLDAWQRAEIAAEMAGLPRAPAGPYIERTSPGAIERVHALMHEATLLARRADARDELVRRWRDTGTGMAMRVTGAWLLEGSWRGGWLRIIADPASDATVVRCRAEPRGLAEDPWTDAARALAHWAQPSAVDVDANEVRVVLPGLEPDADRWQAGVALATALATRPMPAYR